MESIRIKHALALVAALCALLAACMFAQPAEAVGVKNVALEANRTYTGYDVTGDGKADTIEVVQVGSYLYYTDMHIYINGAKKFSITSSELGEEFSDTDAKLMIMKNGKAFIYVHTNGSSEWGPHYVLKWKSGKLAKVLDCDIDIAGITPASWRVSDMKAKGNRIIASYIAQPECVGLMECTFSYAYKGGKLKRTSAITSKVAVGYYPPALRSATMNKAVQGYANAKCTKKSVKLRYGQKVTVRKLYYTKKYQSLQLEVKGGKTCWVKIPKSGDYLPWESKKMFQESGQAG